MHKEIHAHAVLEMLIEFERSLTKSELVEAVEIRFGIDTRYYTCSKSGMTALELVDFLESKKKFNTSENGFSTDPSKICHH